MTIWQFVIVGLLFLILVALDKGNSIKAAQAHVERLRYEKERLNAEERREYDLFFAANGYPHHDDDIGLAAWAAQRGKSVAEARKFLLWNREPLGRQPSNVVAESAFVFIHPSRTSLSTSPLRFRAELAGNC